MLRAAPEGRRRRRDQPRDRVRIAAGFEKALAQVDEVALRLQLAGAPDVRLGHARAGERIGPATST